VKIRPFPYPYKAALAICNDLDCLRTFEEMKAVHDVLNGSRMTPCGPGLGLEVGDSFHFFTVHPQQDDTLAYFDGLTPLPSAAAPALREGIASGLLDILHTWGNYSQKGGFIRRHAEWAVEELRKYGLKIPVWVNHGDRHNFQNLGRADSLGDVRESVSVRGDRSEVFEYHADLAREAGIRYVWIKELTPIPGQQRPLGITDWLECGADLTRFLVRDLLNIGGNASSPQLRNRLIRHRKLRDGGDFFEILRYGWFHKDGSEFLPELLSARFLRRLVETGGACLLYMHLGKGRPSPKTPFSKEAYRALERLAQWSRAGDIWVTTASRLCRYIELRLRLSLTSNGTNEQAEIRGSFAEAGDLQAPDVAGLTIYAPRATAGRLEINGRSYSLIENPADHTGTVSFTVPLPPVGYCWE
jgi:hypothetical protein